MRVRELREQVLSQRYSVDPQRVAAALLERLLSPAGARSPSGPAPRADGR
ncbi:MAG: hypothetical protein JWM31_193 [Solirubrobacterales bacterium]|nr:hypothetical protein [Solirubrobacterales bacterium]